LEKDNEDITEKIKEISQILIKGKEEHKR